jgi:hypothetical protein
VVGACYLGPDQLLVAMGNGSWSDGVYRFNLVTHEFEVVFWAPYPNFLEYHELASTYWLGTQFGSMYSSQNGVEWAEVPFFTGKSCFCFDDYGEWMVVSEVSNLFNVYWSGDSGATWQQAESAPLITDLRFDPMGVLYGIFPDHSNSSGLWRSYDHGNSWDVAFWSDDMSAVGTDVFGNIFVGWKEELGLALYDPLAPPPGLTFLNDGLPQAAINRIQLNPSMSAPAIFICTDSGAYYSYDYLVGQYNPVRNEIFLSVYPNPASEYITVLCTDPIQELIVLTQAGETVYRGRPGLPKTTINTGQIPAGIYIIQCQTITGLASKKIIIR